jgi:type I restriction enzyme S subunit
LIRGKAEREIMLLQEFRTRLVADVVTGQVDVRAIAATLPDAPESFDNTVSATDDDVEDVLGQGEE